MKKFVSVELSREGFLTWIGGNNERAPDGALQLGSPHVKGAVTLLWSEPEGRDQIQPLIAVPTEELRDFLSFVGTYVTTFRPFTAFFRVVPAEMVSAITERQQPSLRTRSQVVRLVAGASMAEASLRAGRVSSAKSTRLSTLAATMSACFGQAVVAGYSAKSIDWLSREWDAIHRRSRDSEDSLLEVASIWKLISDAVRGISINPVVPFARSYQVISGFIADAVESGEVKKDALLSLSVNLSSSIDLASVLSSSREERIRAFNDYVSGLENASLELFSSHFLAGLLLAISGNGSFELIRSGKQLMERYPVSVIWFGICAALFDESNVLTTANCVGRRLVRDLLRSQALFDPPQADLNSYEYRILRRDLAALEQVNARSSDGFEIELLPNVATYISKEPDGRGARAAEEIQVLSDSLQEIRSVLERAQRRLPYVAAPRQREMFRSDEKPKGRSR